LGSNSTAGSLYVCRNCYCRASTSYGTLKRVLTLGLSNREFQQFFLNFLVGLLKLRPHLAFETWLSSLLKAHRGSDRCDIFLFLGAVYIFSTYLLTYLHRRCRGCCVLYSCGKLGISSERDLQQPTASLNLRASAVQSV